MPIKTIKCSAKRGKEFLQTVNDCLKCAASGDPPCEFTLSMLLSMLSSGPRDGIHVTSIISCPRQSILKRSIDYTVDPKMQWYSFRGSFLHLVLEKSATKEDFPPDIQAIMAENPAVTSELHVQLQVGNSILVGTIDEYIESLGIIRDYKSSSKIPTWNRPYRNHQDQINIYITMLEAAKKKVNKAQVVYFDMNTSKKIDCEIYPKADRVNLIKSRMALFTQSEKDIMQSVTDREWACAYCPPEVVTECMKIDLRNSAANLDIKPESLDQMIYKFNDTRKLSQ